jgi:hypothetical protein
MDNQDAVALAQKRLAEAALKQPMTPQGAAISAFVNTTLLTCKVDALVQWCVESAGNLDLALPCSATQRFEHILIEKLNAKADIFENTAREAPRILSAAHAPGHA